MAPRETALATVLSANLTNTTGWTHHQLRAAIDVLKAQHLNWDETTGSARTWWDEFERENREQLGLVHRLAEELRNRNATITEFFLAYVYSGTDSIIAKLHYLDYTRLKKEAGERSAGAGRDDGRRPPHPPPTLRV